MIASTGEAATGATGPVGPPITDRDDFFVCDADLTIALFNPSNDGFGWTAGDIVGLILAILLGCTSLVSFWWAVLRSMAAIMEPIESIASWGRFAAGTCISDDDSDERDDDDGDDREL